MQTVHVKWRLLLASEKCTCFWKATENTSHGKLLRHAGKARLGLVVIEKVKMKVY